MRAKYPQTATREAQLRQFWPTIKPLRVLAYEWGCSEAYVSQLAKKMGLPSRRDRMNEIRVASRSIPKTCSAYLVREANVRGLSEEALVASLINTIIRDRLVGAVLDDEKKKAA